jgi:hypothetical protein
MWSHRLVKSGLNRFGIMTEPIYELALYHGS